MFTTDQMRELVVFNSYKAMRLEMTAAASQAAADHAIAQLDAVSKALSAATPSDRKTSWSIEDLIAGRINLMPCASEMQQMQDLSDEALS